MHSDTEKLQQRLLDWFAGNGRDLPWRHGYAPYHVWLSEIMLQQTQMERGVQYFERWLQRFPTVADVAAASIDEILKYWEGLGYYARARNLHKAAKIVAGELDGCFPDTAEGLCRLPGIGPYTAAAIASIAFEKDVPLVDANVERLYARIFDIDTPTKEGSTKAQLTTIAAELLPPGRARLFNQALMELGALVCKPKKPDCALCPLSFCCLAQERGVVAQRPVKTAKQKRVALSMAAGIVFREGDVLLLQRKDKRRWTDLWEFPNCQLETAESAEHDLQKHLQDLYGLQLEKCRYLTTVTHQFTCYKVTLQCYICRVSGESAPGKSGEHSKWVECSALDAYAFSSGQRKCLEFIRQTCPEILHLEE